MLRLLVLIGVIFPVLAFSQQMRIGVLRDYSVQRIVFAYSDGSYNVFGDTTLYATLLPSEFADLSVTAGNKISLKIGVKEVAVVSKVVLVATKLNHSLVYSTKTPTTKERKYKDDVEITAQNGALTIVNLVDINNYLSGVVESEGGGGREIEYYKVQALMSRTYALKYKTRNCV